MDETSGVRLPASFAAAWASARSPAAATSSTRPGRGPKPTLSLERIVGAAIALADREGIAAISMSRVASEVGTAAMSLYRYVAAKDELLALMVDAAYGAPADDLPDDWRGALERWAWLQLACLRQHRWIVRVPIAGPPTTPHTVAWFERGLAALRDTTLTHVERASVILLTTGYVRNVATTETEIGEAIAGAGISAGAAVAGWNDILLRMTDARTFPELHATIAAGIFDEDDDPDVEFQFGLDRILDGIELLITSRASRASRVTSRKERLARG